MLDPGSTSNKRWPAACATDEIRDSGSIGQAAGPLAFSARLQHQPVKTSNPHVSCLGRATGDRPSHCTEAGCCPEQGHRSHGATYISGARRRMDHLAGSVSGS